MQVNKNFWQNIRKERDVSLFVENRLSPQKIQPLYSGMTILKAPGLQIKKQRTKIDDMFLSTSNNLLDNIYYSIQNKYYKISRE